MAVWLVHLKRGGKSRRKPVFSFQGTVLRTRIYIDGYNLYYGCLKGTAFKWLDLLALFENHILPSVVATVHEKQLTSKLEPVAIKFFTAPILEQAAKAEDSLKCQEKYHAALTKHHSGRVELIKGYYSLTEAKAKVIDPDDPKKWPKHCTEIASIWKLEEKQTDVNIAIQAVKDALIEEIEHVVFVTNDTDIAPALEMIRRSTKAAVGLVIPTTDHRRMSNGELAKQAHWVRCHITQEELRQAQLPRVIQDTRRPVTKPDSWYARPDLLAKALQLAIKQRGSRSKAFQWLDTKNPHYEGKTPLEVLESDQGEKVIQFMENWATFQ